MTLQEINTLVRDNLSESRLKKINQAIAGYFYETSEPRLYTEIDIVRQKVNREQPCRKLVIKTEKEFTQELAAITYFIENEYHRNLNATGDLTYDDAVYKYKAWEILTSIYGAEHKYPIATAIDITRGGMQEVIKNIIEHIDRREYEKYINNLINRHFRDYRNDLYALQHIYLSWIKQYRKDLWREGGGDYIPINYNELKKILMKHAQTRRWQGGK